MTKRKRTLLIAIVVVLLTFALLFCYVWFAPFGRHRSHSEVVLEAEDVAPPPDAIAVIRGGIAIEVSEEKRDQIYETFLQAMEQKPRMASYFGGHDKKDFVRYIMLNTTVEFRYKEIRRYWERRVEYDAILFSFDKNNRLVPVFCKDGEYQLWCTFEYFWFDEAYFAEFKKTIKGII